MWNWNPMNVLTSPCTSAFRTTSAFAASLRCSWSGLSLDRRPWRYGPARQVSTPSHFWAWLGISISKPSPNLSSFHLTVSDQIGKVFTVLKSLEVTEVVFNSASI